ncbi:MAG TPA: sigma-70 family RNA polymerase sigma factor [Methylomirabilota bacterium]|nr:sigma-70 family RNA polymerase sigma factor [Methylomirabilota bacterium]
MESNHPSPLGEAPELADADLARRIAGAGEEPAAFEEAELCRRFARRLYLYGLRHLRAEDRARDLVQEVLLLTLEKLRAGAVREPERIGSFILGAARMTSRAMARAGAREDDLAAAGEVAAAADALRADPLARDLVVRCLEALAERQRTVIVLTYYAEQSTAAIASSLGLSANNVRVIRHRGVAQLRTCLGFGGEGGAA